MHQGIRSVDNSHGKMYFMRSLPQVSVTSVVARRLDRNIYLLHNLIAHATVLVDVPLMNQTKSGH